MNKFLDESGLAYFWGKIKAAVMPAGATGNDIRVSASDGTPISTALTNKAEKYPVLDISVETSNPPDYPQGLSIANGNSGIYVTVQGLNSWRTLQLYGREGGEIYYRVNTGAMPATWSNMFKIATATPPQEYDIQLTEGLEARNRSTYQKDQFGNVHVHLDLDGEIDIATLLTTLPVGFRPKYTISFTACAFTPGDLSSMVIASVEISSNGVIYGYCPLLSGRKYYIADLNYTSAD